MVAVFSNEMGANTDILDDFVADCGESFHADVGEGDTYTSINGFRGDEGEEYLWLHIPEAPVAGDFFMAAQFPANATEKATATASVTWSDYRDYGNSYGHRSWVSKGLDDDSPQGSVTIDEVEGDSFSFRADGVLMTPNTISDGDVPTVGTFYVDVTGRIKDMHAAPCTGSPSE